MYRNICYVYYEEIPFDCNEPFAIIHSTMMMERSALAYVEQKKKYLLQIWEYFVIEINKLFNLLKVSNWLNIKLDNEKY